MAKTGLSFSQSMGNSFRQTVAGIFSDPRMNESRMLEGHLQATLARAQASSGQYVVAAQDTTFYNYSSHQAMTGLGKIQGTIKGIIQHNVFLVNEVGLPLGLVDQQYWSREGAQPFAGTESLKWTKGLQAVNQHLGSIGKQVVLVQDREADIFAFFKEPRVSTVDMLVLVYQPRNLEVVDANRVAKLADLAQSLPVLGHKQVTVVRQGKQVCLSLSLQACGVHVLPDKDCSASKHKTTALSLVIAREIGAVDELNQDVFEPDRCALWYLLSSLPIDSQDGIGRIVDFYSHRWRIERFHYTLKSGALQVEKLQFDDLMTTINGLVFYSVVAWQLVTLTYLLRQEANSPASHCFDSIEIRILQEVSKKGIHTVREATLGLTKLIGFAPSKKQPLPGIKVLSQALERFYYLKIGYNLRPT